MTRTHVPVLAGELIGITDPRPGDTVVDCTFGAGGHARLMAERIGPAGTLVCIDRDPAAAERFDEFATEVACETRFLNMEFAGGLDLLREEGFKADLAYLDLGVSSMQLDAWERGFSYSYDAPLDMRMDPGQDLDARQVVNDWDERNLANAFKTYGEERFARQIAREIIRRRRKAPLETTGELVDAIRAAIPAPVQRGFAGGHPAKRVFQAIRIAVNDELGSLEAALPAALDMLRPGGRLAVISFHSLEDRIVKTFMRDAEGGCTCPPDFPVCVCGNEPTMRAVSRRPIRPSADEVALNPRAASARMRVGVKV
jgi:16S rRNA (cytosine1402-N4)-methyltransferase